MSPLPAVTFAVLRSKENLSFGLMLLSAVLKARGGQVQLLQADSVEQLLDAFGRRPTPVVGFSAPTGLHRIYLHWARRLKQSVRVHTIWGGPHATYFPELIDERGVDAVFVGEGEQSLPEYLEAMSAAGEPPSRPVPGVRHWHRGELLDGGLRPPVADLDQLPEPDWALFFGQNPLLARHPVKSFLASRGCPHGCTYCFNRTWNAMYREFAADEALPDGGCAAPRRRVRTVRFRDPQLVVAEIERVRARWGARLVWFLDSNFAINRRWLAELLPLYRRRVGLPFYCKVRPGPGSDALAQQLVDAGCTAVGIGIESGSQHLRQQLLERRMDDEQIVSTCRSFVRQGALVMSFNMVGLPDETYAEARRTLELNVRSRVDYAMTTFLQPFPGTVISQRARAAGQFQGEADALDYSYFQPAPLRFGADARDRRRIVNLQRLMALAVSFPAVRRHIDRLVELPENRFYLELFKTYNHHAFHRQFYRATTLRRPDRG